MFFFFFNDTATTEIYTLSLHDALPISLAARLTHERTPASAVPRTRQPVERPACEPLDPRLERARRRSATRSEEHRLNSSHSQISYAVFCLKKKKERPACQCSTT